MKRLVFQGLLTLVMIGLFTACPFRYHERDTISYDLDFSFQDVDGNDLVRGIGLEKWWPELSEEENASEGTVKDIFYRLRIFVSESCEEKTASKGYTSVLKMSRHKEYWYLSTGSAKNAEICPNEEIVTYKLRCSYLFGDEGSHEIVSYWDIPKIKNHYAIATCYRVEFEGKVYTPVIPPEGYPSRVVIILEDREKDE